MKLFNYMDLNRNLVQLSFRRDRTAEFEEIYHAHQGMELLYIHEGHGQVIVDQQIFQLSPGTLFIFRPFQLHRVRITNLANERYIRSLFVFEPTVMEEVLQSFPATQAYLRMLWKDSAAASRLQDVDAVRLGELIGAYSHIFGENPNESALEDQLLFLTALFHRLRAIPAHDGAAAAYPPGSVRSGSGAAEGMMEWIEQHYTAPFELKKLAQDIHLSPNYVSHLFRKTVGSSITEYVTARRIRQACWLLQTTDIAVKDIGEAAGFPNFSYFCQIFKRHIGISPYQFKKSQRR